MTMALCHILPETVTRYENVMKAHEEEEDGHDHRLLRILAGVVKPADAPKEEEDHGGSFPTAYILFLLGFWIMQLLDQVAFKQIDGQKSES